MKTGETVENLWNIQTIRSYTDVGAEKEYYIRGDEALKY